MNHGPSTHKTSQQVSPCVISSDAVQADDPAIVCDDRAYWCHISCLGISSHSFSFQCGSANIRSSASLRGHDFAHPNSFSPLESTQKDTRDDDISVGSNSQIMTSTPVTSPAGHSTPRPHFYPPSPRPDRTSKKQRNIKVMAINCNGLKGRSKQAIITQYDPVIMGCESKLDTDISYYMKY